MNCLMKSCASLDIHTIEVGGSPLDWHLEFAAVLVANQQPEGCWLEDNWGDDILCTAWALLVHKRVAPPLLVDVKAVGRLRLQWHGLHRFLPVQRGMVRRGRHADRLQGRRTGLASLPVARFGCP
ncbi:MAG TPA: hypothetical protein PK640_06915 [Verrucomicrobiota bacterium]|nr:hypothetical protein [Verrucomicrobiota bacterium]